MDEKPPLVPPLRRPLQASLRPARMTLPHASGPKEEHPPRCSLRPGRLGRAGEPDVTALASELMEFHRKGQAESREGRAFPLQPPARMAIPALLPTRRLGRAAEPGATSFASEPKDSRRNGEPRYSRIDEHSRCPAGQKASPGRATEPGAAPLASRPQGFHRKGHPKADGGTSTLHAASEPKDQPDDADLDPSGWTTFPLPHPIRRTNLDGRHPNWQQDEPSP